MCYDLIYGKNRRNEENVASFTLMFTCKDPTAAVEVMVKLIPL